MSEKEMSAGSRRWSKRVLVVGWDGADWKMIEPLLEAGQMPALARFLDGGVMGNVASLTPMLSPILWTSIATGKRADKHDILGFAEPDPSGEGVRPVTSTSRACKAIWNILSDAGMQAGVVNWFASHPAERINGFVVTDRFPHAVAPPDKEWPLVSHSVHPESLLEEAGRLRIHPAMTSAAQVKEFLPTLGNWDAAGDKKVAELRSMLAQCATVHMTGTWLMQEREWDFCGIYYDTIDRFAHAFMEFHPPQMEHVRDEDFARYSEVMNACYRFHDMMLARLMTLAGEDTTVILLSDHGFHCDALRPSGSANVDQQPVSWHRPHGILAIHGPHVKKDQRIYGASLLDVAPTVLMLLGLPVPRDMEGNPLRQILDIDLAQLALEQIDTYEDGSPTDADEVEEDPWTKEQMLARLEELGYVERGSTKDREKIVLDRQRNLAQVHSSAGRAREALELYQQILKKEPDDPGVKMAVAMCYLQLREFAECEQIARQVLAAENDTPRAELIMGIIEYQRNEPEKSLEHLLAAEKASPQLPGVHRQLGLVYLRQQRWKLAMRSFRRALRLDQHDAESYDGLGVALRQLGRPAQAVEQHMHSVSLLHYRPLTHLHLGMALAETGQFDWAIRAFKVALEINPKIALAHHCLAKLYEGPKKDPELAAQHRQQAVAIRKEAELS